MMDRKKKNKEEGSKKSSFDPTGVKVCSFYGEKVCECSYCETRSEVRDRKRTSSATIKQNSLFVKLKKLPERAKMAFNGKRRRI